MSRGVGGKDGAVEETGVGREGYAVGSAMGNVKERRLVLRDAVESDRADRVPEKSSGWEGDGDGGTKSSGARREPAPSPRPRRVKGREAGGDTGALGAGPNMASSMLCWRGIACSIRSFSCEARRAGSVRSVRLSAGFGRANESDVLRRKSG